MLAIATLLAALLPAALSESCAANASSHAQFVGGQVQLVPSGQAGVWTPPVELASAAMLCDSERAQVALLGVDAKQRGHVWVLQLESAGWSVLRELSGVPRVDAAALAEGRLALGLVRRGVSELWLMPSLGRSRPDVRQLGAPAIDIALSGDRSIWWVATGTELRGFGLADGSTRESFVFPAPLLAIGSVTGSDLVAVAWHDTVVLVDPRDRPARGVLPWRAQSSLPGAATRIAVRRAGDAMNVVVAMRGSDQELALVLQPSAAPSPPPPPETPTEVLRAEVVPVKPAESALVPSTTPGPTARPRVRVPPAEVEPAPVPGAPTPPEPASAGTTPTQPPQPPAVLPPTTATPECRPGAGESGVIAGRIDDPAGLATELIVHGPDNVLQEAARVVLRPSEAGICFRVAPLEAGRYRLQVMGRGGASLRTRPPFVIVDFAPDRPYTVHFTVDGRL